RGLRAGEGKAEAKLAPLAGPAVHRQLVAVIPDDGVADTETEAHALPHDLGAQEGLENARQGLCIHALPVVPNEDAQLRLVTLGPDAQLRACGRRMVL